MSKDFLVTMLELWGDDDYGAMILQDSIGVGSVMNKCRESDGEAHFADPEESEDRATLHAKTIEYTFPCRQSRYDAVSMALAMRELQNYDSSKSHNMLVFVNDQQIDNESELSDDEVENE